MLNMYDLILAVTPNHKNYLLNMTTTNNENIFTIHEFLNLNGEINDPFMCSKDVYSKVYDELDMLMSKLIDKLHS